MTTNPVTIRTGAESAQQTTEAGAARSGGCGCGGCGCGGSGKA
jgi:hypothetical protein